MKSEHINSLMSIIDTAFDFDITTLAYMWLTNRNSEYHAKPY